MPVPVAPALIVIHAALLVVVHAQPVAAVTVTILKTALILWRGRAGPV